MSTVHRSPVSYVSRLAVLAVPLAGVLALSACRKEVPPPEPTTTTGTPSVQVDPSASAPAASDNLGSAPPAIGAVVGNQDQGGAQGGPAAPTAGDGAASAPGSAPSR